MFPIRDENPHFLTPYATYAIVALNVLAWVLVQGLGGEPALSRSVCTLGLVPGELLHTVPPGVRVQVGPETWCQVTDAASWLSVLSHMFLHGSWMHIIGNMWFLWIFGNNVEEAFGRLGFLGLYLASGVAATAGFVLLNPDSTIPLVGASGAIAGVLGAYAVLFPNHQVLSLIFFFFLPVPSLLFLGVWFLSQFGVSDPSVAWEAHVAGFVFGLAVAAVLRRPLLRRVDAIHRPLSIRNF